MYAAGVLLYEMLTGQKPHQADSPIQVAYKHVHEDIPPPSATVPGIPAYVDALVARATARDQSMRPTDARVLQHQVRRVRNALDHGVVDDPELAADLTPTAPVREITGDLPRQIVDPSTPAAIALVTGQHEHTDSLPMSSRPPTGPPSVPGRPAQRRSRRGPVLLVVLLLVAVLVGVGGWYVGVARYVAAPGVLDMPQAAAVAKVEQAGLVFTVTGHDYSETVRRGFVLSTDPAPGSRVHKHGTVDAVISLGPERHAVPDTRGQSLDRAQAMLSGAHLTFGTAVSRWSPTVRQGVVLASNPAPGQKLHRDAAVNLTVSRGPQPVKIPDFTHQGAAHAQRVLTRLGFRVHPTQAYDDHVALGLVLAQSPSSGTGHKGDRIDLRVSRGPHLVAIPDVTRSGVDSATAALQALGFRVVVKQSSVYIGLQYVLRQTPGGGNRAPYGSTVTLYLV